MIERKPCATRLAQVVLELGLDAELDTLRDQLAGMDAFLTTLAAVEMEKLREENAPLAEQIILKSAGHPAELAGSCF